MKRRDLIKGGVLAGIAGVSGLGRVPGLGAAAANGAGGNGAGGNGASGGGRSAVRNIIFFAYDGFNYEDLALARYLAAAQGRGALEIEAMLAAGAAGSMTSHSLTSVVTDSAAASSAWATGRKVVNGALSMYPDGRELTTVLELARQAGKATGLITTARLTHATPAAWVARVPVRSMEDEIAEQYLAFRPDVLLGGGRRHFAAEERADGRDLMGDFRRAGYRVLETAGDLAASTGGPVLGAFTQDHLPFEIDRRFQGAPGPSLAEIARAGLGVLDRHRSGFVVQIEAGRIDHANHDNDPGASAWDILAADEALSEVRAFVDRTPGTLLIAASDHATGGQAVYGMGSRYRDSTEALRAVGRRRSSYEHLRTHLLPADADAGRVRTAIRDHLAIDLSAEEAADATRILARRLRLGHRNAHDSNPSVSLHQLLSTSRTGSPERGNVNFATSTHTAGLVPVFTYGAWDGPAGLGVVDNTELFGWMARALGTDFRNPEMTEAEALRVSAGRPAAGLVVR
jgi:alkaline phosphatase